MLVERIRSFHAGSDATYGMPRVRAEVIDQGVKIRGKRVARLMCKRHRGVSRRHGFVVTNATRQATTAGTRSGQARVHLVHCQCSGQTGGWRP